MDVLLELFADLWVVDSGERDWKAIIAWWEARRLHFNLMLLGPGLAIAMLIAVPRSRQLTDESINGRHDDRRSVFPLIAPVWRIVRTLALGFGAYVLRAFGLFLLYAWSLVAPANIWYTGGWVVELSVMAILGESPAYIAPTLFVAGLIFSVAFIVVATITGLIFFFLFWPIGLVSLPILVIMFVESLARRLRQMIMLIVPHMRRLDE